MNVYITKINGLSLRNTFQYIQNMTVDIAHQIGCREMRIYRYNGNQESSESLNSRIDGIISGINQGDIVICQLPTGNGMKFERELISHLRAYRSRIAIFIHNFETLLHEKNNYTICEMINLYNQAEILIVNSFAMRQFLLDKGIRENIKFVIQEMWDYTVSNMFMNTPAFKKEIHFIYNKIYEEMNEWEYAIPLKLYTPLNNTCLNISNATDMTPEELFLELSKGGFGLIWYADEYDHMSIKYHTEFWLSIYLAAGIPVIVPAGISNQTLIEENHLGLVVDSLNEAVTKIEAMDESEYQEYLRNIEQFAPALRNGYYTKRCIVECIQAFYRKEVCGVSVPSTIYSLDNCTFSTTVLKRSYDGNMAFSWDFKGNADGFFIYDESGTLIYETKNIHKHYHLITGYEENSGFFIKAYVHTLKGRLIIAKSGLTHLDVRQYKKPKVSLIIPAYNAEEYITRTIDTALAQSLAELEIIIVDDGSTDSTPTMIDWYAEKYSNVSVIHQENAGVPSARNTGIRHANGGYIAFMDNDDMLHPDMIARLYHSAVTNACDIAMTSICSITNRGYERYLQYPMEENKAISIDDFFRFYYISGNANGVVVWNKLYRASLVKAHLFPVLVYDDEAWTPYILSYADKICYLDDLSYEYDRMIRSNTLVNKWHHQHQHEKFMFLKKTIMFYLENGNPDRLELLKELAKNRLTRCKISYGYEEYEKLWEEINKIF